MKNISMRDAFFNRLYEIAKKDRNVIVVSADMGAPSLDKYRRDLASQWINVGIAEQNMVTIATGLALSGKKPYIYAIMPFVTSRCHEMLKLDASLMKTPITAVGVGSGFSYQDSGPTHHCTEDISIMRPLPDMTILNASDSAMAGEFAEITYKIPGPSYVRLDRTEFPTIPRPEPDFLAGLHRLRNGKDFEIIATGNMVHMALEIHESLSKQGVRAGVIDLYRLKPVNEKLLLDVVKDAKMIVTLEEHLLAGGLGSIVAEILADNCRHTRLKRVGLPDKYYYAYGTRSDIQRKCGLDSRSIKKLLLECVRK